MSKRDPLPLRLVGEGTLVLLLGVSALVLSLFLIPVTTDWRPPLRPDEVGTLGMTKEQLLDYTKRQEEEVVKSGKDIREWALASVRSHFFVLGSVYVVWLGWRRPFGSATQPVAFFLSLFVAMALLSEYLTLVHWLFFVALVASSLLRVRRSLGATSALS